METKFQLEELHAEKDALVEMSLLLLVISESRCTLPSPTDSMWTPYGKDHNLQFCIKSIWTPSGLQMESKWTPGGLQVESSTCIITKKYQYFSLLHLFLLEFNKF